LSSKCKTIPSKIISITIAHNLEAFNSKIKVGLQQAYKLELTGLTVGGRVATFAVTTKCRYLSIYLNLLRFEF